MIVFTYEYLEKNGRLANQLYQCAWIIGQQRRVANSVGCIRSDWTYRPYFSVPDRYFEPEPSGKRIDGGTNYFQELRYFDFMAQDIRDYYAPSDQSREIIESQHPEFWEADHRTSVHVRRGDYLKYPRHFPLPTSRYYRAAVAAARQSHSETAFYVFSDDLHWCEANRGFFGFRPDDRVVFMHGNAVTPVEVADRVAKPTDQYDLFYMNRCNAHVISNSTFAIWGAWLPDSQEVYVPDRWFGPELSTLQWKLAIPDHWKYLPC